MISLLAALFCLQDEVRITRHGKLDAAQGLPVAVSADGKRIVYVKKDGEAFVYMTADGEGKNAKELFKTPVDWDDMLVHYIAGSISADGLKVAVATTKDDGGVRQAKDPIRVAVVGADGKAVKIESDLNWCSGFGWAGERLVFLDSADLRAEKKGYALRAWDGKKTEEIQDSGDEIGVVLQVSPDGSKAAFFTGEPRNGSFRLRVVDLKTKAVTDSEEFRSDDVSYDGPPLFYWDAEGKGLFYHACPAQGKRPFSLMRFDVAKKTAEKAVDEDDVAMMAVLDKEWVAVQRFEAKRAAVLRLADKKLLSLQGRVTVIGGAGRRAVIYDADTKEVAAATLELPK
jgi:hypothetical protein